MRSIGADKVVDYTQEDFTLGSERYDIILDVHPLSAGRALEEKSSLRPKSRCSRRTVRGVRAPNTTRSTRSTVRSGHGAARLQYAIDGVESLARS